MEAALKALAEYDKANSALASTPTRRKSRGSTSSRIPLLRAVVKAAKDADDQLNYNKQIVDSLVAAYQTGAYPAGPQGARRHHRRQKGPLASYAAFRTIGAEFVIEARSRAATTSPTRRSGWASSKRSSRSSPSRTRPPKPCSSSAAPTSSTPRRTRPARTTPSSSRTFPDSPAGKKAAGALRRLDLVGKSISIKGTGAPGRDDRHRPASRQDGPGRLLGLVGRPVGPPRHPRPPKVAEKYRAKGLQIVGVSLDTDKADLDAFQKEN